MNSATLTIMVRVEQPTDIDIIRRRCVQAVEAEIQTLELADHLDGLVLVTWNMHLSDQTFACNDPETTWTTMLRDES